MPITIPLTAFVLLPFILGVLILFTNDRAAKVTALGGSVIIWILSCFLFFQRAGGNGVFTMSEQYAWLPEFGLTFHLGVDGVSTLLIVLTTFLQIFAVAISPEQPVRGKWFYALLMLLETALIGSFASLDLVLFFLFFELSLVPVFFLTGIWGGRRRQAAAVKFFVYTSVGSLAMLAGILALHVLVRALPGHVSTFDYVALQNVLSQNPLPIQASLWILAAFAFAFAVKTPLWPFHGWQADTYAESPTGTTVMAAAVLSKLGTYGFYRFCLGLFPEASRVAAPVFVGLAVVAILYGAIVAITQKDSKRLAAFSSVSHLGFVVLGLFAFNPTALTGAVLQMVNHGLITGAMFLLLGMLQDRYGTTRIRDLSGVWDTMPVFARIFFVVTLASVALPLTNGFVGEFMILLGAFQTFPNAVVFATIGVILSAIYMLWMYQRVFYGLPSIENPRAVRDISKGEWAIALPFVILIFALGVAPSPVARFIEEGVRQTLVRVRSVPPPVQTTMVEKDNQP